jgi:hypothetical protein
MTCPAACCPYVSMAGRSVSSCVSGPWCLIWVQFGVAELYCAHGLIWPQFGVAESCHVLVCSIISLQK